MTTSSTPAVTESRAKILATSSVWSLSAATALVTSKYILVDRNYFYPLHLLTIHLIFAIITSVFQRKCSSHSISKQQQPEWQTATSDYRRESKARMVLRRIVTTSLMAISMPLLMQAVLHFPNLPTLAMLALISSFFESSVLDIRSKLERSRSSWVYPAGLSSVLIACVLILSDEYRLMPKGLIFALPAFVCIGIARGLEEQREFQFSLTAPNRHYNFALPLAFFITVIWAMTKEHPESAAADLWKPGPFVLPLNIASTVTALLTSGSLFNPPQISVIIETSTRPSWYGPCLVQLTSLVAMVGFVGALFTAFTDRAFSTPIQLIAFGGATAFLTVLSLREESAAQEDEYKKIAEPETRASRLERHSTNAVLMGELDKGDPEDDYYGPLKATSPQPTYLSPLRSTLLFATLLSWLTFIFLNFTGFNHLDTYPFPSYPNSTNPSPNTNSSLDVVISMYREPLSDIQASMDHLNAIPEIASQNPQLYIYTKDESADAALLSHIKSVTNAAEVIQLPNVGREGSSYLTHILSRFSALPAQTIFLQADVHSAGQTFRRLENAYTSTLGFLPLGISSGQEICETCTPGPGCGDRFAWYESDVPDSITPFPRGNRGFFDYAYRAAQGAFNGSSTDAERPIEEFPGCAVTDTEPGRPISLSYKGQFLASRSRLQRPGKKVYQTLLDLIADDRSYVHKEPYLRGRKDELSRPVFGYALERAWGVLMGCAEGAEAWRGRSLLGKGMFGGGDIAGKGGEGGCYDG